MMCDLRVAARDAVFGVYCRRWGVPLIDGGTVRLPRMIGHSHTLDLILTGRGVSGDEARAMGLANRLTEPGEALAGAIDLAGQIAAFPQRCTRSDRASSYEQWDLPMAEAMANETRHGLEVINSGETLAGAARFASGEGRHGAFDRLAAASDRNPGRTRTEARERRCDGPPTQVVVAEPPLAHRGRRCRDRVARCQLDVQLGHERCALEVADVGQRGDDRRRAAGEQDGSEPQNLGPIERAERASLTARQNDDARVDHLRDGLVQRRLPALELQGRQQWTIRAEAAMRGDVDEAIGAEHRREGRRRRASPRSDHHRRIGALDRVALERCLRDVRADQQPHSDRWHARTSIGLEPDLSVRRQRDGPPGERAQARPRNPVQHPDRDHHHFDIVIERERPDQQLVELRRQRDGAHAGTIRFGGGEIEMGDHSVAQPHDVGFTCHVDEAGAGAIEHDGEHPAGRHDPLDQLPPIESRRELVAEEQGAGIGERTMAITLGELIVQRPRPSALGRGEHRLGVPNLDGDVDHHPAEFRTETHHGGALLQSRRLSDDVVETGEPSLRRLDRVVEEPGSARGVGLDEQTDERRVALIAVGCRPEPMHFFTNGPEVACGSCEPDPVERQLVGLTIPPVAAETLDDDDRLIRFDRARAVGERVAEPSVSRDRLRLDHHGGSS